MSQTVTYPAPVLDLQPRQLSKFESEKLAFLKLRASLLETHRGKYVAVHGGVVVDSDEDEIALAQRVYAKHGYVPIYVGHVSDQPQRPVRIPSPRIIEREMLL